MLNKISETFFQPNRKYTIIPNSKIDLITCWLLYKR